MIGIDEDGNDFQISSIQTMFEGFYPRNITIFELFSVLICMLTGYPAITKQGDDKVFQLVYFFFRFTYNVGLGCLLTLQSKFHSFTNSLRQYIEDDCQCKTHPLMTRFIHTLIQRGAPADLTTTHYPTCFLSWLVFKHLENFIMWTDGWSFCALAVRCWDTTRYFDPSSCSILRGILLDVVGIALVLLNCSAKMNAVKIQGVYAWFYGDFFFRTRSSLLYSGIYRWIPHPMYTVGYSAYYGLAILSRSRTVLLTAIIGHTMQMGFLMFVEIPHMKRTYPSSTQ